MVDETPRGEEAPIRVCPKCSVQSQVAGDFCPHCGKSYMRGSRKPGRKTIAVVLVAVLLIVGVGAGIALKVRNDRAEERAAAEDDRRAAEAAAALEAEEQQEAEAAAAALREQRRDARQQQEDAERRLRRAAIKEMQKTITKDARESVDDGLLEGPILYTFCNPLGGGSVDDLTALTTTFDCLAVNEELGDGRASGYGFDATMNWDDGSYTWQLSS